MRYRYELEVEPSRVVFEALYSYPQKHRRTLFERDGDKLAFRRGTRFTGGGRELITPTTLVMSVASRLTEEIDEVARRLSGINYVGLWPRSFMGSEARLFRSNLRWTLGGWDDFLTDVFDEAQSRSHHDSDTPAGKSRTQHRDLALSMLLFADLGVQGVEVVDKAAGAPAAAVVGCGFCTMSPVTSILWNSVRNPTGPSPGSA